MQRIAQNAMPAAAALFGLTLAFAGCGGGGQISSPPTDRLRAVPHEGVPFRL
jgi:hypothetical protein